MNENGLRTRTLFELAQSSNKQTFLDAKTEFMMLGYKPNVGVEISSSPKVSVGRFMDHVTFKFYGKRDSKRFELENYESKTVEFQIEGSATKRSIVLYEIPGHLGYYGCALESMEQFLDFIMYLRGLFGARVSHIDFNGDQAHHLARLYSIEMFRECKSMSIFRGTLSNEEMRQMLKFRVEVISMCIAEPDFELLEPISMGEIYILYAHWFKGPMLMQLDCETVFVDSLQLQNVHINAFLHHWMKSSNRKLRNMQLLKECKKIERHYEYDNRCRENEASCEFDNRLDIIKNWEKEKFDLLKITEGLSSFEEPKDQADVENRLCFKRPTDRMLITVEVEYHREWVSACFIRTKS